MVPWRKKPRPKRASKASRSTSKQRATEREPTHSLLTLPAETIRNITRHFDLDDTFFFMRVCKKTRDIISASMIHRLLPASKKNSWDRLSSNSHDLFKSLSLFWKENRTLDGHWTDVCLSDGLTLATCRPVMSSDAYTTVWPECGDDASVYQFDGTKLEHRGTLLGSVDTTNAIFSPNDSLIATMSGRRRNFKIWDSKTLNCLATMLGAVRSASFISPSLIVVEEVSDRHLRVLRVLGVFQAPGRPLEEICCIELDDDISDSSKRAGCCTSITLTKELLAAVSGQDIHIWKFEALVQKVKTEPWICRVSHKGRILSLAFSGDGERLAFINSDGVLGIVRLADVEAKETTELFRSVKTSLPILDSAKVLWDPSGNYLTVSNGQCVIVYRDTESGWPQEPAILNCTDFCFSWDGRYVVVLRNSRIEVWRLHRHVFELANYVSMEHGSASGLVLSPDERLLLVVSAKTADYKKAWRYERPRTTEEKALFKASTIEHRSGRKRSSKRG